MHKFFNIKLLKSWNFHTRGIFTAGLMIIKSVKYTLETSAFCTSERSERSSVTLVFLKKVTFLGGPPLKRPAPGGGRAFGQCTIPLGPGSYGRIVSLTSITQTRLGDNVLNFYTRFECIWSPFQMHTKYFWRFPNSDHFSTLSFSITLLTKIRIVTYSLHSFRVYLVIFYARFECILWSFTLVLSVICQILI